MYQIGKSAAIFLKHRMAKGKAAAMAGLDKSKTAVMKGVSKGKALAMQGAEKSKSVGSKIKKKAKKIYKKNPIFDKSDVAFIKQNPKLSAGAAAVGAVAGEGLYGLGSGTYNLATGQRNVRVKKETAKEIIK